MKTLSPSEYQTIVNALQCIHDDADHALGTDSDPQERLSVARQDLDTIKQTVLRALEILNPSSVRPNWTLSDQTDAMADGWLIAEVDGKAQIQRLNEPAQFDCDENAVAHVKQQASGPLGSPLCKLALQVVGIEV